MFIKHILITDGNYSVAYHHVLSIPYLHIKRTYLLQNTFTEITLHIYYRNSISPSEVENSNDKLKITKLFCSR